MVEFCADIKTFSHVFESESVLNALMSKYFSEMGVKGKKERAAKEGNRERDDIYVSAEINIRRAARYLVKCLQTKCEERIQEGLY